MNFWEIFFYLIIITFIFWVALFVYIKKENRAAKRFFELLFYIEGWIASLFLFFFLSDPNLVLWIGRFNFAITLPLVFSGYRFVLVFPKEIKSPKRDFFLKMGYLLVFIVALITLLTPFIIEDEIITGPGERITIYGPFFSFWIFTFFLIAISIFSGLFRQYKNSQKGIEKKQAQYVFIGIGLSLFSGIITNIFFYAAGVEKAAKYGGPFALLILSFFIAYAILRHRLMDIRVATGKTLVYVMTIASLMIFSYLLFFLGDLFSLEPIIKAVVVSLIAALIFNPLRSFFLHLASKYFYYSYYSSQKTLSNLSKKLTETIQLEELSDLITSTLVDTLKLSRAVILLRNDNTGKFEIIKNIGFREENGISLVEDNFLTDWLEKNKKPLVYEELTLLLKESKREEEKERIIDLKENMKRIEAKLCLPLIAKEKIIGIIVLGEKVKGDPYSQQDIELLDSLSNQFSVSMENAKLYSKIQSFSKTLRKKVDEQTKELKEAYEELKATDKAKSEFIAMASHQLRTPLASIKGYLSMIEEERYGEVTEKTKEKIRDIFSSTQRLINIVNKLLNISKIDLGKIEIELKEENLKEVAEKSFNEMKVEGEEKGLKMIFSPKEEEITALLDKDKIKEVITSLIDNAIKYTEKGEVEVIVTKEEGEGIVKVRDTGEGISEEERENIFKGFSRGSAGRNFFIEGTGLGLYLSQKYIDLHKGNINVDSQGEGKGTVFSFSIPLI